MLVYGAKMGRKATAGLLLLVLTCAAPLAAVSRALADSSQVCHCDARMCHCAHHHHGTMHMPKCRLPGGSMIPSVQPCGYQAQATPAVSVYLLPAPVLLSRPLPHADFRADSAAIRPEPDLENRTPPPRLLPA